MHPTKRGHVLKFAYFLSVIHSKKEKEIYIMAKEILKEVVANKEKNENFVIGYTYEFDPNMDEIKNSSYREVFIKRPLMIEFHKTFFGVYGSLSSYVAKLIRMILECYEDEDECEVTSDIDEVFSFDCYRIWYDSYVHDNEQIEKILTSRLEELVEALNGGILRFIKDMA